MSPLVIAIAAFVGVAALVGGLAVMFRPEASSKIEDRLDILTGSGNSAAAKEGLLKPSSVLSQPLDAGTTLFEDLFARFGNMSLLFEQADTSLTVSRLVAISAFMAVGGAVMGVVGGIHFGLLPVLALFMASLPLLWVLHRRKRRMKIFGTQLPDAMDMLARALRSGQSLGAGFNMISQELNPPLGKEFGRVFEEQNLGISMEESLRSLGDRIPNLDLKFFVTAVILQRQTGGDLAEILDKIGHLIRERFQIWGQIQSLTGEGRLSGIVLLALPVLLFFAVYQLNREYVMVLFTEPMGKKMLAAAVVMQVLGALVIRKIINIKV
jgi:tight adherence protein B